MVNWNGYNILQSNMGSHAEASSAIRKYFPIFMKYITGGYVGEEEAGTRLFQVLHDPKCTKSGVHLGEVQWGEQLILRDEFMEMKHTTGRWSGVQEFIQPKFGMKLPYLMAKQQNFREKP